MRVNIIEIHPGESPELLNTEWFVLANDGETPFSTRNCRLSITRGAGKKKIELGTLDPGFQLAPGQRTRVITGSAGKKSQGKPPEDEIPNYHLFLKAPVLKGAGTILVLALRSLLLTTAEFDPEQENGVARNSASQSPIAP